MYKSLSGVFFSNFFKTRIHNTIYDDQNVGKCAFTYISERIPNPKAPTKTPAKKIILASDGRYSSSHIRFS